MPSDLRLRPGPVENEAGVGKHAEIRREEADHSDAHARPEVSPDHGAVDFSSGQEGEEDGAEAGKEIDPLSDMQPDGVAGDDADHDFD